MRILAVVLVCVFTQFASAELLINGAGASFPYPLYSKWFAEYAKIDKSVKINYQSIGSGGGIRQFLKGTTDFGASDAPMKDTELKKAKTPILHIPTVLGAVCVSYNLQGLGGELKLTPQVLVEIFSGKIQKWDNKKIKKLNPALNLPKDTYIIVAHRSDGSGTTAVFTDYLAKVSPAWKKNYGYGKGIKWPVGLGGKGNEGVTGLIKNNPGSIGYIEMTYAVANKMPVAALKNREGEFVGPTEESVAKAAAGAEIPQDYRTSITDAAGKGSYPLAAFTYLLVSSEMDGPKGEKIVEFLKWAMGPGQKLAGPLHYSPLPKTLTERVKQTVAQIKVK
ncbi:MAG: phosphate ABC transporter substrate-binding protein PstS [Bdellovibrionales bacterium]|nr:phosphate ABC transporter substrate-binding protein PstS [Bdellovibrionales bacterium]